MIGDDQFLTWISEGHHAWGAGLDVTRCCVGADLNSRASVLAGRRAKIQMMHAAVVEDVEVLAHSGSHGLQQASAC